MNGMFWKIGRVPPDSGLLVDRTGRLCLATTSPTDATVYLSSALEGEQLVTVLLHELVHCALWSHGLLGELREMAVPGRQIDLEEWICNILADYGRMIFGIAYNVLGDDAWRVVPVELDRVLAA